MRNSIIEECKSHVEKLNEEVIVDKTDPDWEDKLQKYRNKIIGNVRFVGELFNDDFITAKLLLLIINQNLLYAPRKFLAENIPFTSLINDLVECCCILCSSTGLVLESSWETE